MDAQLISQAQDWINEDCDPQTQRDGQLILDSGDHVLIASHFGQRLSFGTAGLRGELGPGPNRMNRSLVRRVTYAVGQQVISETSNAKMQGFVIGYDGRHGSLEFAREAVGVLTALGIKVYLFDTVIPTPRLSHSIRFLGASGGIMVTASHNPPRDNGYKVFWGDSAQIISPLDRHISERIDGITQLSDVPFFDFDDAQTSGLVNSVPEEVHQSYFEEISRLRVFRDASDIRIVYSAMHGVGKPSIQNAFQRNGYTHLVLVPEQAEPDPDFPTVSFPNPEEPGAMDLALQLGRKELADVVLANDPDADRLCVALPIENGEYRLLTGNEVGVLLAEEQLSLGSRKNMPLVVTTIVSTQLLSRLATYHGAEYAETLTGFKWIAHKAMAHKRNGGEFVMGFEEALGYSVGSVVRDKDGVSAALLFADIVARCHADGITVWDQLEKIYRRHGYHCTAQKSFKYDGADGKERISEIMEKLRSAAPKNIAGVSVVRYRDLSMNQEVDTRTGQTFVVDLPKSNVLSYTLETGSQILVRPSGTEPKIKFYFEVCVPCLAAESYDDFRRRGQESLHELMDATLELVGL